ncbi:hypothetical protein J416_06632 [Gracilibacillus halophilus YIM-C55.5]|uniref:DUF4870 domain-containing protein n=1 Tax=Gracilibacillus halophilus YIM-C55.5 TaxID=1308866 RepID=N4WS69_9BACI|nr:DUF4870 domain-containing protein [Gracilibacillus halophilus]ENH97240.1 hypothetical protein J416_06632 [Gracilibacillus halophilus YIM-C55.5]
MNAKDEGLLAMLIYLTSFFTTVIGPLLIWLIKREESELVDFHGKEYLNFAISIAIYSIVSAVFMLVIIGFFLIFVVGLLALIFTIIAAVKAYQGEKYRIPISIPFIK